LRPPDYHRVASTEPHGILAKKAVCSDLHAGRSVEPPDLGAVSTATACPGRGIRFTQTRTAQRARSDHSVSIRFTISLRQCWPRLRIDCMLFQACILEHRLTDDCHRWLCWQSIDHRAVIFPAASATGTRRERRISEIECAYSMLLRFFERFSTRFFVF
jgi:hypothetical protein